MGKKCCAPNCRSGYSGVKMKGISMHIFRKHWKEKFPREGEWNTTGESHICSKHFSECDFVTTSLDKKACRTKNRTTSLTHRYIKKDAVPTIFPDCPKYLSTKTPLARKSSATSSKRNAITAKRYEDKKRQEEQLDRISSLTDIGSKLKLNDKDRSEFRYFVGDDKITIYGMSITKDGLPNVKYTILITSDMKYKVWHEGKIVPFIKFNHISKCRVLSYFKEVLQIVDFLQSLNSVAQPVDPFEEAKYHVQELQNLEYNDELICQKIIFLTEQLELAFMHNKHRRYSSDLLSTCVLWENTSPNLYKQIQIEGVLTLPSQRYLQKLTSAISVDTGLSEQTLRYLKARVDKLGEREKIGALLIDEVYVSKRCEFTRSDGRIYGMEEGEPTKTLLTVMYNSVAADYQDVIAMVPTTKIDSTKINKVFDMVLNSITTLGYNVVASLVDGHSSNVKFYTKELCQKVMEPYICNPHDKESKLFLLFDPTHIFKCIYNNFQKRKIFQCPKFEGTTVITANFDHIKDLYNIENTKAVKMAYQLSDECLNPQAIEKSNVSLATRIFSESTRNAMKYYIDHGYPHWQGTLDFLNIIAKWWSILNVKSPSKGKRKRDANSEPITTDNIHQVDTFFSKIVDWLSEWKSSGNAGLSNETFKTFKQTSKTFPLLSRYLLGVKGLKYVLGGKISSDFIEKRFGRYRQLSGANYFASERQFIEAEKSIRVKSLIKFSKYSIKDVSRIMTADKSATENIIASHSEIIMNKLSESIDSEALHMDNNIIFYVAGFIARSLKKTVKCKECSNILGSNEEISMPTVVDIPEDCDHFLNSINRGGLIKPSDIIFISCIASWKVFRSIMDNHDSKSYLLSCKYQRPVFVKCLLTYIKDSDTYSGILATTCMKHHSFDIIIKRVAEKLFNVMTKNFVSEVNSTTHANKKRKSTQVTSTNMKIRKLQSDK